VSANWSRRLDNPVLVQWEYASEERLRARNEIYRDLLEGPSAEEAIFVAVAEVAPQRVLDIGCGTGETAERIARELGCEVIAADQSGRMVELARERGLDARVADIQALPFADSEFDCVVAGWVLYHVQDRERAISEVARVLRPGGRFVTATMADDNFAEVWELLNEEWGHNISFDRENGAAQLAPYFERIQQRNCDATVVFPSSEHVRRLISASMNGAHLGGKVPELSEPLRARARHTVFVAEKAA
jgi:ubiquinone/menaquinone biosynthesis C-methylase UbiE